MLVSAEFGQWIVNGIDPKGGQRDFRSEPERFAEHEREVMNRTNGIRAAGGRLNIPWPRSLGTPPWGAEKELEYGAARPGATYAMRLVRFGPSDALRAVHRDMGVLFATVCRRCSTSETSGRPGTSRLCCPAVAAEAVLMAGSTSMIPRPAR